MTPTRHKEQGYVALVAAVILTLVILTLSVTASISGYFNRFNIVASYAKERSSSVARSCIETARLKVIQSSSYGGNENVSVGAHQCMIYPIETNGSQKTVKAKAIVERSVTNLRVVIVASDASVFSWEEMPAL